MVLWSVMNIMDKWHIPLPFVSRETKLLKLMSILYGVWLTDILNATLHKYNGYDKVQSEKWRFNTLYYALRTDFEVDMKYI